MYKLLSGLALFAILVVSFAWQVPPSVHAQTDISATFVEAVPNTCNSLTNPTIYWKLDYKVPNGSFNVQVIRASSVTSIAGSINAAPDPGKVVTNSNNGIFSPTLPPNSIFTYTILNATSGQVLAVFNINCSTGQLIPTIAEPQGDTDSDGVLNAADNCPFVANVGQADGYGSAAGDACDQASIYDTLRGAKIFQMKDGTFHVYGNCRVVGDQTQCVIIAILDARQFSPEAGYQAEFNTPEAGDWRTLVAYLGKEGAADVYQVNIYNERGRLITDGYFILVNGGVVSWKTNRAGLLFGSVNVGGAAATGGEGSAPAAPTGFTANPDVRPGGTAVAIGGVNIRTEPSLNGPLSGQQVLWGEFVTILAEDPTGYWFLIRRADGSEGWVSNEWFAPPGQYRERGGANAPDAPQN
jgi:hypothetical protein